MAAWAHSFFIDHAFFRLAWSNLGTVEPGVLYRSNHPTPFQLRRAVRALGLKSVINLRGGFGASFYALEKAACAELGLTLVNFTIASRDVPTPQQVRGAKALFNSIEYPALMHCKSGADRAGIMSVFYRHFRQGQSIAEAVEQLSPRYLHVRAGLTGVLDYIFDRYRAEAEPAGLSFLEWVESPAYDPATIKADFRANWWGTLLSEKLFRRE
jgi:protein tyrosine/serine phosphatase